MPENHTDSLPHKLDQLTAEQLDELRGNALACAEHTVKNRCERTVPRFAHPWIMFLTEFSEHTFYLEHCVARDEKAYAPSTATDYVPRLQETVLKELPWLEKKASKLTITEAELARTIFKWQRGEEESRPKLVWWLEDGHRDGYPYILPRVQRFLLRRYCWPLLSSLGQARRKRYFVSSLTRIAALSAVGLLAIANIGPLTDFFDQAATPWQVAAAGLSLFLLITLAWQDVLKQNHGLIQSLKHAFPRVWGLVWRIVLTGCIVSAVWTILVAAYGVWGPEQAETLEHIRVPVCLCHALAKTVARGITGALIGMVIQWLFDDVSLTEPV